MLAHDETEPVSRTIGGRYRLDRLIGVGSTARVWRATDMQLGRPVAVKLLDAATGAPAADATIADAAVPGSPVERLSTEARAAAALTHPGIATVHDIVFEDGAAAIVMEYVKGDSLAARIAASGPLDPREAARIAAEIAEALDHAHARGIVHRDVKPGNVLIDEAGHARLIDLGISKARVTDPAQARPTHVAGTLRYMSPEHLAGEPPDPRSDVFALGAVLYEMLGGTPAFRAADPESLRVEHAARPAAVVGAPGILVALAQRALDPDPALRPPTAGGFAAELRDWLAAPAAGDETVLVAAPMGPPVPLAPLADVARRRSRPGALIALGLATVVGAGALIAVTGGSVLDGRAPEGTTGAPTATSLAAAAPTASPSATVPVRRVTVALASPRPATARPTSAPTVARKTQSPAGNGKGKGKPKGKPKRDK